MYKNRLINKHKAYTQEQKKKLIKPKEFNKKHIRNVKHRLYKSLRVLGFTKI